MRTLRIFENAVEAEILRTRLDAAGIFCVVNGSEVATMLSHIGTAAVKVRVEVAEEDYQRALSVLEHDNQNRLERKAWTCLRCNELNEPAFDLCWYCGKRFDGADSKPGDPETEGPPAENPQAFAPVTVEENLGSRRLDSNPYSPPGLAEGGLQGPAVAATELSEDAETELNERVARIFHGAVIGCVLLPPVLSLYILAQLIFSVPKAAYQLPVARRRLIASWVLCSASIPTWSLVWGQLYL